MIITFTFKNMPVAKMQFHSQGKAIDRPSLLRFFYYEINTAFKRAICYS